VTLKNAKHRYILRVDNDATATHSWKVQIRRRGRAINKHFTDSRHGGKRKALAAAKDYRDRLVRKVSGAEYAIWKRSIKRPDNKSGVVGVARFVRCAKSRYGTWQYPVWEAFWHDADGKKHGRRFSVIKLGEGQAMRLALKTRREAMKEVEQELVRRRKIYGG
jgi:1,2-phenylacetyl-CoA epoxidase PaaB subunit